MLSVPLIHHVYSSVGGYKTIYETQDPAAQRIAKALVAVANTAYKGGMGATFRGYLRFQLPLPADFNVPRTQYGPWQMPPSVTLGCGRWYLKSFPMGTDHVGRPRACVHSIVMLPERFNPPAWWQPNPLSQLESSLISTFDLPADQLFLNGRDSLQGLRERTRDQIPWQPNELLNRMAGLEWLAAGNLPPALVGSILKLLLYPGSRLWMLASEEHALFIARMFECILPGGYRRTGGLLLGPHVRYIVPPLSPPNMIQIARPSEYPAGECLVDLQSNPPRWIGPEPPISPLAGTILEFLNHRDLNGLLKFIEMWDIFDEQAPTPQRQVGGLAVMTSLNLIGPQASNDPWPDWTRDASACASALPFFVQAGWLAAHDTAWRQVKTALKRIGAEHLTSEVKIWDHYIEQVKKDPTLPAPPPPMIKGIVSELEGPSHSNIIRAIDDTLPDKEWEVKGSGHALAALPPDENEDVDAEFDIPADHLDTSDGSGDTGHEPASDAFDVDAEFALPSLPAHPNAAPASDEPKTVQEDWAAEIEKQPPVPPPTPGASVGKDPTQAKKSGQGPVPPPRISSALEAETNHGIGTGPRPDSGRKTSQGGHPGASDLARAASSATPGGKPATLPVARTPAAALPAKPAAAHPTPPPRAATPAGSARPSNHPALAPIVSSSLANSAPKPGAKPTPKSPTPTHPQPPMISTTQSGTLIAAIDADLDEPTTGSSSVLLIAAEHETNTEPATGSTGATATLQAATSGTMAISPDPETPPARPPNAPNAAKVPNGTPGGRPGSGQGLVSQPPTTPRATGSGSRPVAQLLAPHEDTDDSEIVDLSADDTGDDTGSAPPPKPPAPRVVPPGKKPPEPPRR